jgi:ElaB/YqjD/DUF883 family membrane-anchored ribosome-binding protein
MENNLREITKNLEQMLKFAGDLITDKQKEMESPEQKAEFLKAVKDSDIISKIEDLRTKIKNI